MAQSTSDSTIVVVPKQPSSLSDHVFSWHNVGFSIQANKQEKVLLDDISGSAKSGDVLAILGASGAGKTTLLNALAGRLGPGDLKGQVLLNGQPRNPKTWVRDCSYVEQDDLMFTYLTVEETIGYSARLRLPSSMSALEKKEKIDEAILDLGLNGSRKTRIGNQEVKGISGGERKRVAIGMELITEPRILFMDEPTSGLDAFTAFNMIESVKKMAARRGMIVIMTIHQPRTDILELFDKVLLLSIGKTIWFGPVNDALSHFEKLGYPLPPKTNPSDFFLDIMTLDQRSDLLQEKSMDRINTFINAWAKRETVAHETSSLNSVTKSSNSHEDTTYATPWWNELMVLLSRNMKETARGIPHLVARLVESMAVMLILGFIFFKSGDDYQGVQNKIGILFFMCINLTFSFAMPNVVIFPFQRLIIRRERASGAYRSSSAFFAKWVSTLPITFAAILVFALPIYWMIGLHNDISKFFTFVAILIVHANAANALGLFISAAVKTVDVGLVLGPLILTVFLLFGGPLVSLKATPVIFRWIQYVSIIAVSNKALTQNEFAGVPLDCTGTEALCYKNGDQILDSLAMNGTSIQLNLAYNILLSIGFLVVGFLFFSQTSKPSLRLK